MSYTKITLNGKEQGLKFNQMALLEIGERNNKNKYQSGTVQNELYATASIVFAGLRGNAYAKDIEEDFTWEECVDWTDTATDKEKVAVVEALTSSEKYKQTVGYKEEQAKEKPKKKSALKSTKASASK